jgi:hypothetical protein
MPGRLKSGLPPRMTSSRALLAAEAEEGATLPPYALPGPGRQSGLIGLWLMEVKWLASLPSPGLRAPSGKVSLERSRSSWLS